MSGVWNSSEDDDGARSNMTLKLWINLYGEQDNTTLRQLDPAPCSDDSADLQELRVVVLLVIGAVGLLIVGALLCCMLYKNERILQTIPGTKEYKRRKDEPEYFYPIPRLGAIKVLARQGKAVAFLTHPELMESALFKGDKTKGLKLSQISKATQHKDLDLLRVDDEKDPRDASRSDVSSFYESDGFDENDSPGNTFPAGGDRQIKKKKKQRQPGDKRIKRLRKKNKYSTTVFTKGTSNVRKCVLHFFGLCKSLRAFISVSFHPNAKFSAHKRSLLVVRSKLVSVERRSACKNKPRKLNTQITEATHCTRMSTTQTLADNLLVST